MTTLLSAVVALAAVSNLTAQIGYTQTFDSMAPGLTPPTGFTGNFATWSDATTCSGFGVGIRRNLDGTTTTGEVGSFLGVSTGNPAAFAFDYKVHVWNPNTVPATAPWGTIDVQISNTPTGPWTTIGTITDETQTTARASAKSFPVHADPPVRRVLPLQLRVGRAVTTGGTSTTSTSRRPSPAPARRTPATRWARPMPAPARTSR
jgi:hypothetical protein